MNILLFAGTSEGRELAQRLAAMPLSLTVSVATEYGLEMLRDLPDTVSVMTGRMDGAAMAGLLARESFSLIVDATHPYAILATDNIRAAAAAANAPVLRLLRAKGKDGGFVSAASAAEAARLLADMPGNILLTIGSKELAVFTTVPGFPERVYPRLLPASDAVRECERLGFLHSRVIAMQGPFSRELNLALMRQFAIAVMVTKDGGAAGGFPEKLQAAEEAGVRVIVIGRPPEENGLTMDEVVARIEAEMETER